MPEWIHTLTVDASYDVASRVSGVGIVVQARTGGSGRGPIIDQIAEAHVGLPRGVGEIFAVLRALETARDRGFTRIRIRSDYNSMRRKLRECFRSGAAGSNALQQKILNLARRFEWIDFGYVPRRKNQIAHALARRGRFLAPGPWAHEAAFPVPPAPKSLFTIEPLTFADTQWVRQFIVKRWHAESVVAHGQEFYPSRLPGLVALSNTECIGLVTYLIDGGSCEIITLDSLRPGLGVGKALLDAVKAIAQEAGCDRLWLMTTNDNLRALGFYQKCGFILVAVHGGAVEKARQMKPSIPLIGEGGIPIRDELELKMFLGGGSGAA